MQKSVEMAGIQVALETEIHATPTKENPTNAAADINTPS